MAAQFLTILRTIFPKFAAPLRKEAKGQSPRTRSLWRAPFPLPGRRPRLQTLVLRGSGPTLGARFRHSQPWGRTSIRLRPVGSGGRPGSLRTRRGRWGGGESCAGRA